MRCRPRCSRRSRNSIIRTELDLRRLVAIGANGRLPSLVPHLRFFSGAVMKLTRAILIMFRAALILVLCAVAPTVGGQKTASVQDAEQFMNNAESRVAEISVKVNRADWVHSNFITEDTEALAAEANDELTAVPTDLVQQSKQLDGLQMPPDLARKFMLLRLSLTAPAPKDPKLRRELTKIATSLEG